MHTLLHHKAGVAHNPSSNLKLASGIAPVSKMLEHGLNVGIGTDGPASNNDLDMFEEMRLAAFLAKNASPTIRQPCRRRQPWQWPPAWVREPCTWGRSLARWSRQAR